MPRDVEGVEQRLAEMKRLEREIGVVKSRGAVKMAPLLEQLKPLLDQFSELQREVQAELGPLLEAEDRLAEEVQAFCEVHKAELTADSRTYPFRNGSVQWYLDPAKLMVDAEKMPQILKALRRLRVFKRFTRVKYELKRNELKENPEIVAKIDGLSIEQGERFIINLDEVVVIAMDK